MKGRIFINLLPSRSVRGVGAEFFSAMIESLPRVAPEKYGKTEPLKIPFDPDRLEDVGECWADDMFWRNPKSKSYGNVLHSYGHDHTTCKMYFDARFAGDVALVEFFRRVCILQTVDYGSLHLIEKGADEEDSVFEGIYSHDLEEGLPGIPWLACYGKPYVDALGDERLLSAPGNRTESPREGLILVQATERIGEIAEDRPRFQELRQRVKSHLGEDMFVDYGGAGRKKCRVPKFEFTK